METANGNKNGHSAYGGRYKFDEFEIDPANRLFLRDGVNLPMTGKVFDLLLFLAENPGRLLEKDELIESVWPGTFVEEGNLARTVSTVRKVLGDESKPHKFIETVPGHGYRFIADVEYVGNAPGFQDRERVERSQDVLPESPKRRQTDILFPGESTHLGWKANLLNRPWFMSLAVLCIAAAAIIAFRSDGDRARQIDLVSYDRARRSRLTQEGNVYGGFISPDGLYLAFTRITSKNERALSLRQIATGSEVDLRPPSRDVKYWAVAFSRDSAFLYYIACEGGSDVGKIYRIPLLGGNPRPIVGGGRTEDLRSLPTAVRSPLSESTVKKAWLRSLSPIPTVRTNARSTHAMVIPDTFRLIGHPTAEVLFMHSGVTGMTVISGTSPRCRRREGRNGFLASRR